MLEATTHHYLQFPGTAEHFPFRQDILVYSVEHRMFALLGLDKYRPCSISNVLQSMPLNSASGYVAISPGYPMNNGVGSQFSSIAAFYVPCSLTLSSTHTASSFLNSLAQVAIALAQNRQNKHSAIFLFKMKPFHLLLCICGIALHTSATVLDTLWSGDRLPPMVRMIRIYGGNDERLPPILLVSSRSSGYNSTLASPTLTVELDIAASVPPDIIAVLQHCTATWEPDNNPFALDPTASRAVVLDWRLAPPQSRYYTHRAVLQIPSTTLRVPVGGNWKLLFYEIGQEKQPIAEARFFALEPAADCLLTVMTDFYQPRRQAAPSARVLEAVVGNVRGYTDAQVTTAVFYRMQRWNEPYVVTGTQLARGSSLSLRSMPTMTSGMIGGIKRFRIEGIPSENDYRRLDAQNLGLFPRSTTPIRLPIADIRRRGQFGMWATNEAAMITSNVSPLDDEYVPIEFVLDPEGAPVRDEEVFIVGSMNNWQPSVEWMMTYDTTARLYRLRQWVRRGQHAYMYATGVLDADSRRVRNLSFEEFEGNNSGSTQMFLALIYARSLQAGGYDTIIAACSASAL